MYRSEAHEQLSKQTAQEAHTEKGATSKEPTSEQTRTVASLCLHNPWRRTPRPSLEPSYQEDPTAQGAQVGQEAQTILTEDHPGQQPYPPLILFPSNPPGTSNPPEYLPYSSMA